MVDTATDALEDNFEQEYKEPTDIRILEVFNRVCSYT